MKNNWSKRVAKKYTCDSGNQAMVRRSSPSLALKSQRFLPILKRVSGKDGKASVDAQLTAILALPDDELEQMADYAAIVLEDAIEQPQLFLKPKKGQLSPNDIHINDFWELFIYISRGCPEIPVKTKEGETDVDSVANFPDEPGRSISAGNDSESVQ